ncbi:hypothetical protein JIN84_22045 [Luteolibacter yonseiensis]|uniref:Uncharacterized protein n=1 Tax=Luteolibacter yonseiensis TaxID=1144680 RepID=A0A934VCG4_9BACT|nr:hypothetical protein [Luteolibacter yonseiensis]MBK1818318.1 hypothetical protein [Luteolibacter yonseiensis]
MAPPGEGFGKPKPVHLNGVLAYISKPWGLRPADRDKDIQSFDQIKEGMTFREIVSLLGPGVQDSLSGVGMIFWGCKDGRVLVTARPGGSIDEKTSYQIRLQGRDQRHKDVAELARTLIADIEVSGQEVKVALTKDSDQAKAREVVTYQVGGMFQWMGPSGFLPRVDFTIEKIEGNSVFCHYYYGALPEGLLHYSDSGSIILTPDGKGGVGQPATEAKLKEAGDGGR